ncbi:unnamed protein product [Agarophyton chilense]|eukprot:gb/GEZJ01000691.1/.p1 GENE.gb/GEZJ01000691.1/~~gb/GEZJ01000691.1/.p1  ORF type:complete len:1083 (+),score=151.42 gb/GEZJ01000691.1/:5695-8943(+)
MVLMPVNGIEIDFPYEPYGAQIRYMSHVIDALRNGSNALLESPTGTGKTLCLLCASLAWRHTYIAALQARTILPGSSSHAPLLKKAGVHPSSSTNTTSALDVLIRPQANAHLAAPRIVFASRTHSQLAQAINELKQTVYKPSMSILASRDQLCVHPISESLSGSRLNSMCRRITQKRQCRFHTPIASTRPYENQSEELVSKMQQAGVMDIEELREFGKSQCACPWFLSRAAAQAEGCEILFIPYNYLLDKSIRSTMEINWSNDIVIIDEAHNLESICADSNSFDLTSSLRSQCDAELSAILEGGIRPGGIVIPALQQLEKTEQGLNELIGTENRELQEIRVLRNMLHAIEYFVGSARLDRGQGGDVSFSVYPGSQIQQVFKENQGPTVDTYELFLELLDRAMGREAEINDSSNQRSTKRSSASGSSAMKILQAAIRILFETTISKEEQSFRTVVQESKTKQSVGRTISYWCFKPAIAMNSLKTLNLRCLLLTSGTLSPMDSFAAELGLGFPVRLENPHVVTRAQIWAGVISTGPDVNGVRGARLTSAYHARGENSSIELGRTLIRIASIIPDGLLVFFPSYGSLNYCVDVWHKFGPFPNRAKPSIWEHLLQKKGIVVEERDSSKSAAAILAHRTNVDNRLGSILLAVCRGKVSEGIDFSDEYGRAVVITGLPYPSALDPKVVLKREFVDREAVSSGKHPIQLTTKNTHIKTLNGSEWYTIQAIRAVNQAVGRAIRHRFDYGAIILCDERFQAKNLKEKISKWIRPNLSNCPSFATAEGSLERFYSGAVVSRFAKEGEKKRLEAQKRRRERSAQPPAVEIERESMKTAQQLLNGMNPPRTTDREFLDELMRFSARFKDDELLKLKEKTPAHDTKKVRKTLDFGSQEAHGGMLDSGSLRLSVTNKASTDAHNSNKRGAVFLTAQPETIDEEQEDSKPKRRRGVVSQKKRILTQRKPQADMKAQSAPSLENKVDEKPKLSNQIKTVFSSRQGQRRFLKLFRDFLTQQARVKEGVGPLQSEEEWKRSQDMAKQALEKVVLFTMEQRGAMLLKKDFLRELRAKIPSTFQNLYDAAVSQTESNTLANP